MKKLIFEKNKKRRYAYKEEIKIRNNSYGISNMKINSTLILKTLENYKNLLFKFHNNSIFSHSACSVKSQYGI